MPSVKVASLFSEFFVFRLLINTTSMIVLVRMVYYYAHRKKDLFAPFFLLNFVIFLLAYILKSTEFGFGSLGLLAAFTLLRFRTDTMTVREVTYLFIIMTIAIINSVMVGSYLELLFLNGMIIIVVFITDGNVLVLNEKTKNIKIEGLELIKPEQRNLLIEDMRKRTGLNVRKISIKEIDFIKNQASIKIYYSK